VCAWSVSSLTEVDVDHGYRAVVGSPEPPVPPPLPPGYRPPPLRYGPPVPGNRPPTVPSPGYPPPQYGPLGYQPPRYPPPSVVNPGIPRAGETAMGRQVRIGIARRGARLRVLKYIWPVFILLIIGGVGAGYLNKMATEHQPPPLSPSEHAAAAQQTASDFLQLIVAGRLDDAYFELCTYVRGKYTRSQFDQYAKAHPLATFTPAATSGPDPDVAYFTFTYTNGKTEVHGVHVNKSQVCGTPY
jgi:hypothetical protein